MTPELYILIGVTGMVGGLASGIAGTAIGFYRAKASLSETYITKRDCESCKKNADNIVSELKSDLRQGHATFEQLKIDMVLVKSRLGIKNDLEEMKKILYRMENGDL